MTPLTEGVTPALVRRAYGAGLVGTLLLAVPDLTRQLPVRDDPSVPHAVFVDAIGVLSAAVLQVGLVGLVAGGRSRRWLPDGLRLVLGALRRAPVALVGSLAGLGAVSALLTLVPSLLLLGRQVLGPLHDPALGLLVAAQLSDVVATAVTAPAFALVVLQLYSRSSIRVLPSVFGRTLARSRNSATPSS